MQKNNFSPFKQLENFAISVRDVTVSNFNTTILNKISFDVRYQEIFAFIGPSGCGKSFLMRTILGLHEKTNGKIKILGRDLDTINHEEKLSINSNIGVLFQGGALLSSFSVLENIKIPMREHLKISLSLMEELARLKIQLVGLDKDAAKKYPYELSGGMIKRAALARSLALDPKIIFLDEPTSGLDPVGASEFDNLINNLKKVMGLTVYIITHDLESLYSICDKVAVLGERKIIFMGKVKDLPYSKDPWVKKCLFTKRHHKNELKF